MGTHPTIPAAECAYLRGKPNCLPPPTLYSCDGMGSAQGDPHLYRGRAPIASMDAMEDMDILTGSNPVINNGPQHHPFIPGSEAVSSKYQSGPLDMMNLSEGRAPHEAITRVKQLEAIAERLGASLTQLVLAWSLRNNTSQVNFCHRHHRHHHHHHHHHHSGGDCVGSYNRSVLQATERPPASFQAHQQHDGRDRQGPVQQAGEACHGFNSSAEMGRYRGNASPVVTFFSCQFLSLLSGGTCKVTMSSATFYLHQFTCHTQQTTFCMAIAK